MKHEFAGENEAKTKLKHEKEATTEKSGQMHNRVQEKKLHPRHENEIIT